jgi:hypothetical protein
MHEISKLEDIVRRWRDDDLVEPEEFLQRAGAPQMQSRGMSKGWICFWIVLIAFGALCMWLASNRAFGYDNPFEVAFFLVFAFFYALPTILAFLYWAAVPLFILAALGVVFNGRG